MRSYKAVTLLPMLALLLIGLASANTLMGLSGHVLDNNGDPATGNLSVTIYTLASGGSAIYDSGSDFDGAVINGTYNVMLGSGGALHLVQGNTYYLDMSVNGEDIDFSGNERQMFISPVGEELNTTNVSTPMLCLGGSCRTAWPTFAEAHNGTYNTTEERYVYSSGTAIGFNETLLNATIDARASGVGDGTGGWTNSTLNTSTSLNVVSGGNVSAQGGSFVFLSLNGTLINDWNDISGSTDTQKDASGPYLSNDSTTIYFNETMLNATIAALGGSDTQKDASGPYLSNDSTTIYFNESLLNATIDDRASVAADGTGGWTNSTLNTSTSLNVVSGGNITAMGGFFSWLGGLGTRITSLFVQDVDVSGNLTLNGTSINDWSDVSGGADTQKDASGPYLSNDSTTIYFNESLLNATIVALRVNDTQKDASGPYLSNDSTTIYFNESLLNATIAARASGVGDGTGGWSNDSVYTNTSKNVVIAGSVNVSDGAGENVFFVDSSGNLALGKNSQTASINDIAIGTNAEAAGWGVALGYGAYTSLVANPIAIGTGANTSAQDGISIGNSAKAYDVSGIAIGHHATAGYVSVALGSDTNASGIFSYAFGRSMTTSGNYAMGFNLNSSGSQVCAQDNTMCILGGRVGVDVPSPTTNLDINSIMRLVPNSDTVACNSSVTGAVRMYNNTGSIYPCYCNGTAWVKFENYSATC